MERVGAELVGLRGPAFGDVSSGGEVAPHLERADKAIESKEVGAVRPKLAAAF